MNDVKLKGVTIRKALNEDVPAILHIRLSATENVFLKPLTEKMLKKALNRNCQAFVAEIQNEIIGFSLADKSNAYIWGLFVLDAFQGKGIGKVLLQMAVNWLWKTKRGILRRAPNKIFVTTRKGSKAEKFYQHKGWVKGKSLKNSQVEYWLKGKNYEYK